MLLHKVGKEINEENVKKVLEAAGVKVEEGRVKALIAALDGVNIDEAIKEAAQTMVVPATSSQEAKTEEKPKEEKKEDSGKKAEEAAAGLGSLFG